MACLPTVLCFSVCKPLLALPWWLIAQGIVCTSLVMVLLLRLNARTHLQLTLFDSGDVLLSDLVSQMPHPQLRFFWCSRVGSLLGIRLAAKAKTRWLWLAHDAMSQPEYRQLCRHLQRQ